MTKTSQLNDIGIMMYHGGFPAKKISIPFFCHYFDKNHMKDKKIKRNCIIIETNEKNVPTEWKIQGRCFQTHNQSQIAFQGGGCVFSWTVSIY